MDNFYHARRQSDPSLPVPRETHRPVIGVVTLAVVFSVLCLAIFAALSASTAASEMQSAQKYADAAVRWNDADRECAVVANAFGLLWQSNAGSPEYAGELEALAAEQGAELIYDGAEVYVTYSRRAGEYQSLYVELLLGEEFSVLAWQSVPDTGWEVDDTLPLWDGT